MTSELRELHRMTVNQLRVDYEDVFGEAARTRNKDFLVKRIAWRLQANSEGGLTERALRRAAEQLSWARFACSSQLFVTRQPFSCQTKPPKAATSTSLQFGL